uniref:Reverse transcriptase domain-containing protein n=1 Tax=Tanacetum cinerariifolium TaxID=118510 RepID=A0A6L2LB20_TANCI|nr:reverse transcriptase domain-containing protein [Tanacetum cinerariifolium]
MRTRSKSYPINSNVTIPRRSNRRRVPNIVEPEIRTIEEVVPMDDRTMEELLQAPTKWYRKAIVILEILAENFEIKTNLLQLVQTNKFPGFDKDNPHTHISNFKRMTSTLKYRDVPNHAIKLMLFPYSLEGAARIWYEKEPPTSILTWDDLVNKFFNQFFPPSKTTHLKNEISRFTQRFEETFEEAWECFKEILRACPHHGISELTQIDTNQPSVCAETGTYNQASTLGNLPSNTVPDPMGEIKDVTTHSGLAYEGPSIPTNSPLEKNPMFRGLNLSLPFLILLDSKVPLNENCSAMLLEKLPEKLGDRGKFLIPCDFLEIDLLLPELTPTRMTLELADRSITRPKGISEDVFVKVGKFHFPTDFVVVDFEADLRVPLILGRSFLRTGGALIDVYGEEITLRVNDESVTFNLNQTMRYSLTYDDNSVNRVNVIDIAYFHNDESIPTGIDNSVYDLERDILYLEKLLNEDPFQLPPMDLKQAEETKAKSSIEESPELELKELPSHLEYAFLEDIDKLPVIIAKDLKDIEKEALIKVLKSHKRAISLKIFDIKGYFQIPIDPQDQEKTTFTCPYGTFAYRRMPFGLCNAPGIFQRCMMDIFQDMIEKIMEMFMDDFSVFRDSFSSCLTNLDKMLKRCEDTNLVLNWEKCHFMCKEGIVLGHKISKSGIEVDRAKVDVIAKLPHPTIVKGVRIFLGHVGFYRRFIQDFSEIARPMTHLLEKETPFVFSKECIDAFEHLKKKLTEAPILVVPDWNLPFKLMCDASDFVIGAVLGQSIDYLSKWVEAKSLPTNDARVVVKFLKSLFSRFGILRARGTHFCNDQFTRVMIKYGVTHRLAAAYHPQTSGQVEVSNHGLKRILERTVGENRASWSDKLDDALWAFRTTFKTSIGCTPYKMVSEKLCHLPIELEHRAYWALKHVNFDLKTAGDHRKLQLNELNELRDQPYENSLIYKERTKKLHDSKIKNRIFNVGDEVLLFNSRLKIFTGKQKTHWSGPFTITQVFPYVKKVNDLSRLQALVNRKKVIITEATIRDAICLDDTWVKKVNDLSRLQALVNRKKVIITEATIRDAICLDDTWGKGCSRVETPLFEGMIVAQQVGEGAAAVNVKDVPAAGVTDEGAASVNDDDVPAAVDELSIPSPTPSTQPTPTSHDIPSTSQGRIIADIDADKGVTLKDVVSVFKDVQDADIEESSNVLSMQDDEVKPADLQEVVEVVTSAKLITKVVIAASATITTVAPQLTTVVASTLTTAPSATRRRKGAVIRYPEDSATPSTIIHTEAKSKDKGKGILVEEPKPLKKQDQIKHEYNHVQRKEKEYNAVKRYQALKKKPQTEAQARKNIMIYLINVDVFKMDYFKGMTYDDIRPISKKKFNSNVAFLQKTKEQMEEEDSRALKRLSESQEDKAAKKQKLDEEVEELRKHLHIVPNDDDDVYTKATPLALKVPVVDCEIHTENNKPHYKIKKADGSHQLYLSYLACS